MFQYPGSEIDGFSRPINPKIAIGTGPSCAAVRPVILMIERDATAQTESEHSHEEKAPLLQPINVRKRKCANSCDGIRDETPKYPFRY